ncbi:hypothetical protein [Niastella populi]|uniref:Uncharacterized protein n=1 Tax=Niastella populi TaxID=550983 RepID=A0A1V9FLQ7_9BACT|nr:hypothetical protein [Niastella populi]OQP59284.1 hypothetical protein A4R26_20920 [Niastella populi]
MRLHNGMRPQDIVVLLKIIAKEGNNWHNKNLSEELFISASEVSESLRRSGIAGLIDKEKKKKVFRQSLMEFLQHGIRFVFPVLPGTLVNGIPTAHSHPFMRTHFSSESDYVWPDSRGYDRGLSIEPLYKNQVKAAKLDANLYKMLALVDVIRVGRVRETIVAVDELKKMIL